MLVANKQVPVGTLVFGDTFRVPGDDDRVFVVIRPEVNATTTLPAGRVYAVSLSQGQVFDYDAAFGVVRQTFAAVPVS